MNSVIALKALNQYRKRDIYAYLDLRYYLNNSSANSDAWIDKVCSKIIIESEEAAYLKTYHFKGVDGDKYILRDIYLPTSNEILGEVLLINELAKYQIFHPKKYVFSYRFSDSDDPSGVFSPYFNGIKERHDFISTLCWENEGSSVLYTDIKRFYPSIKHEVARKVWLDKCLKSDIDSKYITLGTKLLDNHFKVNTEHKTGLGVLTGPMFSHVIANLLLDDIDTQMNQLTNGCYCRYVDDVILVGTDSQLELWRNRLEELFSSLGLDLHDGDKDFSVPNQQWLNGKDDFNSPISKLWIKLIADIKRFLFANPTQKDDLVEAFKAKSIRIPVLDYSLVMNESSATEKLSDWVKKYKWAKKAIKMISVESILSLAEECKQELLEQVDKYIKLMEGAEAYDKKRYIPKVRFISGRLLAVLDLEELKLLALKLSTLNEFHQLVVTMNCIVTRNVTECLKMGANATQGAAQLLSISSLPVYIDAKELEGSFEDVIEQSLAVLDFNNIKYEIDSKPSCLRKFAKGMDIEVLMSSKERYVKSIASLHGIGDVRHKDTLSSCFDRNEELLLDILNQVQSSKSG